MTFKLTKMSYFSHNKRQKVCLRRVWIRLTSAYLLCARESRQNNALALQFWCLSNALTLRVRALEHQNLSACALFCLNSLAKVNTQLLIYNSSKKQFLYSKLYPTLRMEVTSWGISTMHASVLNPIFLHTYFLAKQNRACIFTQPCIK